MPRSRPNAVSSAIRLPRQSTTVPNVSNTIATGCLLAIVFLPWVAAHSQAVRQRAVKRGLCPAHLCERKPKMSAKFITALLGAILG